MAEAQFWIASIDSKVIISLVSVTVGWVLAQGTEGLKSVWKTWMLKRGLLSELRDVEDQLNRTSGIHLRQIQLFANGRMESSSAFPVHHLFFTQHYKDVFSSLNRSQRLSYQHIHSALDALNSMNTELSKFGMDAVSEFHSTKNSAKADSALALWGARVIACYEQTADVQWHVTHHLRNKRTPRLNLYDSTHRAYLQFREDLGKAVAKAIVDAKAIPPGELDKTYSARSFEQYGARNRK